MPSQNRKTDTADRPSPKARAAGLRAQATRPALNAQATDPSQPVLATHEPNPALAALIVEHRALLASHNDEHYPDAVADTLFDRAYARFREACAIPAASLTDLRAKFDMVEPELREAVEALGSLATCALDSLAADIARVREAVATAPVPLADNAAEFGGLPHPEVAISGLPIRTLPVQELRMLFEVAETFRDVGNAVLCQPRCIGAQRGDMVTHNAAGHFAYWLTETAGIVRERVLQHAKQIIPASENENEARLSIIAYSVVANDEPDALRLLARDLEAQAQRVEARG